MLTIQNMRTSGLKVPLGIGSENIHFSWELESDEQDVFQRSYQIRVMHGREVVWDTGTVDSEASASVKYDGPALSGGEIYSWNVAVISDRGARCISDTERFELAITESQFMAQWIEPNLPHIYRQKAPLLTGFQKKPKFRNGDRLIPPTHFRKEFACKKTIDSARLYITAHGIYEAHLNGRKIGDRFFAPEYTSYYEHLLFQTYDVTEMLHTGGNALGIIVADGWWGGSLIGGKSCLYGDSHGLWLQLEIAYSDGQKQTIISDGSFKCSTGPCVFADLFIGEKYDARQELNGWSETGFDDSGWKSVHPATSRTCKQFPQESPPVRVVRRFAPKEMLRTPKGEMVLDVGENIAGFLTLRVTAKAGTVITMQHAEVLDQDGNYFHNLLYVNNLQMVTYICKGEADEKGQLKPEVYTPQFSWQGFRYVRLTGDVDFSVDLFTVNEISSDNDVSGKFSCSNPKINQLQENIVRSQTGNYISIPTDCPQRERAGWTGDAEVFCPTACFNRDVRSFFHKWMKDVRLDQNENGAVSQIVPRDPNKFPDFLGAQGLAGWSDACIIIPYVIYERYGDGDILRENYDCMEKWLGYVEKETAKQLPAKIRKSSLYRESAEFRSVANRLWVTGAQYGDWLIPSLTSGKLLSIFKGAFATKEIFATGYYARTVEMMCEIAKVLKKQVDFERYSKLYQEIKKAFQLWFIDGKGFIQPDFQGAIVLALQFKLIPDEWIEQNVELLVTKIKENGGCLDTGFLSVPYLLEALSSHGRLDEAYKLLFQDKYPSWMYEINLGATTMWETWGAISPDKTPKACSYNHYAFGSVGNWIYSTIGGLVPTKPGYQEFVIQPQPHDDITSANLSYHCPHGMIKVAWAKQKNQFHLDFTVPANTRCTVVLPDGEKAFFGSGNYQLTRAI